MGYMTSFSNRVPEQLLMWAKNDGDTVRWRLCPTERHKYRKDLQNHRIAKVGRTLQRSPSPTMSRDIFNQTRLLRASSNLTFNASRDGASTISLGNLRTGKPVFHHHLMQQEWLLPRFHSKYVKLSDKEEMPQQWWLSKTPDLLQHLLLRLQKKRICKPPWFHLLLRKRFPKKIMKKLWGILTSYLFRNAACLLGERSCSKRRSSWQCKNTTVCLAAGGLVGQSQKENVTLRA